METLKLFEKSKDIFVQLKKDGYDETEIKHIISILKAINDASDEFN